jgi:type III secretory pathway component EscV
MTAAVVLGSVSYVCISTLMGKRESLNEVNNWARGITKSLFSIMVGAMVLSLFSIVTGIPLLAFTIELALFGMFALTMVGNVFNALDKGYVEVHSGDCTFAERSPSYGAILLFANTVDLFVTAVRVCVLLQSDNTKGADWVDVVQSLFASAMLLLGIKVLIKMVTNSLEADRVFQWDSRVAPAYDAPVNSSGLQQGSDPSAPPKYEFQPQVPAAESTGWFSSFAW